MKQFDYPAAQASSGEGGGEEDSRAHFRVRERVPGAANARRDRISGRYREEVRSRCC